MFRIYEYTCMCIHMCIHIYIYIYIHTHTYIYVSEPSPEASRAPHVAPTSLDPREPRCLCVVGRLVER